MSAAIPSLIACPAWAAKWEIHPTLSAETLYTDNVALAPAGSKRSDWVTQLTPGVSVVVGFRQSQLSASYGAQILYSAQTHKSAVNHQFSLNSNGSIELVPQLLFLDAHSSVGQQNVSLLAPQAQSNINDTGNRATVSTLSISPYLRHSFGQNAQALVRLTYSTVSSSAVSTTSDALTGTSTSIGRSQSTGLNLGLSSGPAFRLTTWSLAYSRAQTGYSGLQDTTSEIFSAGGRRLITPTIGLIANVGHETNNLQGNATAQGNGTSLSGTTWSTGLDWTPTPRTHFAATFGKRPFGDTHTLDFSHRTRLTTWNAGYSEDITTTHAQALLASNVSTAGFLDTLFLNSVPDPAARQLAVKDFIAQNGLPPSLTVPVNFLTTQTFLVKSWRASVGIQGVRNTVLTSVFTQTSENLTAGLPASVVGDFGSSSTVKQTGGSALWNWRFATHASSNLSASYTRSEFPTIGRKDDVKIIGLSVSRQFQPRLFGSLNYRNLRNQSNQSGAEYTENAVSAALNMSF